MSLVPQNSEIDRKSDMTRKVRSVDFEINDTIVVGQAEPSLCDDH